MEHRYIVVEGPIGVGKTSLTRILAERFGGRQVLEVVEENPFLSSFYEDREKYAFQTQVFFLLSRFRQQQELFQQDLFRTLTVSDYLFAKDRIFALLNLERHELALYDRVYEALGPRVTKPDLVVYLQARQDVLLGRIKKRGRDFERQFDAGYLAQLAESYNDFFLHYRETPLLVVNTSEADFVNEPAHQEALVKAIVDTREGVHHFKLS
jgi:deoxyadenosine/deoxycytidine kinase